MPTPRILPNYMTMNRLFLLSSVIFALSALTCSTASAQKHRKQVKKVQPVVVEPTEEEIAFENLLPATAKVMFIDSVVVNVEDVAKHMPLSRSCGNIEVTKKDSVLNYSFTNEFENRRYLSVADAKGIHKLYVQDKLGRNWSEPELVKLEGDFKDIICPYVMPDGVTLSFAALKGDDNLGKHDIFYTVFDSDNNSFYRPQSLGLPFNSSEEDYYYVIDDFSNVGYLATSRKQKAGKTCIYVFVPTETRETYEQIGMEDGKLERLARIHSIAETQVDKNALAEALSNYNKLRSSSSISDSNNQKIYFVINGSTVYTKLSQFKSATNKAKFAELTARKAKVTQQERLLTDLRAKYHKGDTSVANNILNLESRLQEERKAIKEAEKQIRNAEIMKK